MEETKEQKETSTEKPNKEIEAPEPQEPFMPLAHYKKTTEEFLKNIIKENEKTLKMKQQYVFLLNRKLLSSHLQSVVLRNDLQIDQDFITKHLNFDSFIYIEKCKFVFQFHTVKELKLRWWTSIEL